MNHTSSHCFRTLYHSPMGEILLTCDEAGLTGLWFEGAKFYAPGPDKDYEERETPVFAQAKRWLDLYFSGRDPDFMPPVHMVGTPFQRSVWELLQAIPYGKTTTYGEIGRRLAAKRGRTSAQAVGGAVGHNPISIIVPCHRVVGSNGSLTGYAGGIDRKARLLRLEGADMTGLFVPAKGTAL